MDDTPFTGPIFLVGMPRSGTKLLRTLLNEHTHISISPVETHFLPLWTRKWSSYGDLNQPGEFVQFYDEVRQWPYFTYLAELQPLISASEWHARCKSFTPDGVFEALLRFDTNAPTGSAVIWGDKSPSYVTQLSLLKELYPKSRVIHIVRDVRDFCLSSRQAWGKSMLRAAQAWTDGVEKAIRQGREMGDDYYQLRYEDLLADSASSLGKVCEFLGVEYQPSMLSMSIQPENLGDTRGSSQIESGNTEKYKRKMDRSTRERIEAIACKPMRSLGYAVEYSGEPHRLPKYKLLFLQLLDGLNLIRFEVGQRGLFDALSLRWKLFRTST